jgi:hypothetical protein
VARFEQRYGTRSRRSFVIEEWKRQALTETEEEKRRSHGGLALVFAEKAGCLSASQTVLEGWNVERSQVLLKSEERGELKTNRALLLELLKLKFNQEVPADMVQLVEAETNLTTLHTWFQEAVNVPDLDSMREKLSVNGV